MAEINEFLSPKAEQQIKDYIKVLGKMNTEYSSIATSLDKLNSKSRNQGKNETKLTELQKERISVAKRTKKVFAQNLAAEEKATKTLILGQERLKIARKKSREEAQKQLGVTKKGSGLFRSMTKSILAAGAAMLTLNTAIRVVSGSFKTIAGFERGLAKVRAVTNATAGAFIALQTNAQKLGATTSKSATQVAGLQLEFSKLGFSTKEILAATEATISLSIAAGSDLADSAVVAASTVRGFGLTADDTQKVVDVMAKSFASSALDMEKFKTAMSAVAPVAKANGKDIEFVTARLSVLSDAGLDASTSGTSLRNMFLNLSKEGLTWEEGLEKINSATDKNVAALDLFGKRGATAALILAANTDKAAKLEKAYNNSAGAAKRMADIMEDDIIGEADKFKSALEGLVLSLNNGDGAISRMSRSVIKLGTNILGLLTDTEKESEALSRMQIEMNANLEAIKNQELPLKVRNDLIEKVNTQYKDYLPNLIDEKTSLEDIEAIQKDANKALLENIKLKAQREILEKQIGELSKVGVKIAEKQIQLEKLRAGEFKQIDQYNTLDSTIKTVEKDLERLIKQYDLEVTELNKIQAIFDSLNPKQEESTEIIKKNTKATKDNVIAKEESVLALKRIEQEANIVVTKAAEDEKFNIVKDNIAKTIEANKEKLKIIEADEKASEERKQALKQEIFNAAVTTGNILFDLAQSRRQRDIEAAEDGSRRQRELMNKQAKSERNQALFSVAMNTARGITAALTSIPPNVPLSIVVGAIGAIQSGAILSQPLPAFFEGTDNAPSTFIAGDKYGRELIAKRDGSVELSPNSATIYSGNEYKGASIIPNSQTERILSGGGSGYDNARLERKLDKVVWAIERSKPNINISKNAGRLNVKHLNRKYGLNKG